jgi:F0F1-type ATP synthase beta subunit
VTDSGAPITVPVGDATLGRILNVIGEPIDDRGPIVSEHYAPIHQAPPSFTDQGESDTVLVTGIKVLFYINCVLTLFILVMCLLFANCTDFLRFVV